MIDFATLAGVDMPTSAPRARPLRFDNFELDVRAGELRKRGVRLRLHGQPLQVLAALLSHAGDVVTREELRAEIWTVDTFVDFDHSLHNAIARLREVLGDSAETPRYIETLPRRGYRFIAPVESSVESPAVSEVALGPSHSAQSAPPREVPVASARRAPRAFLAAGFLTFLVVSLAVWLARTGSPSISAARPFNSIAVLPLENLSGDPSEEFFADGMTDQLITDLAKVQSLRVISRTSVMQYKGTKKPLPEIARELNVDAIVEGSVIRSGERVRVTAQLVRASTDQHLWAETYDRDRGDVLELQGDVAESIAQQVRAQLTPQQQAQLRSTHVVNPAAYDAYLKGRLYFTNEFTNPDSLKKAQQNFAESIQKDPNFALAYAGLADSYVYLAFEGVLPRDTAYRSAKEALAKAVQLDDTIGEAHDTLGVLSWRFDWDWDAAEREFNRAIALAPSYSCAHEDRALFLGFTRPTRRSSCRDRQNQPTGLQFKLAGAEAITYYELKDYPELITASKRGLLLNPQNAFLHYLLGVGYEASGALPEAVSEYQKVMKIWDDPNAAVALAHAYSAAGRKAEANKILATCSANHKGPLFRRIRWPPSTPASAKMTKLSSSSRKPAQKSLDISLFLTSDLRLDNLRPDPRFQSLLRGMALKN